MASIRNYVQHAQCIIEPDHGRKLRPIPTGAVALHFSTDNSGSTWDEMMGLVCDDEDALKDILELRHMFELARCRLVAHLINDYEMDMSDFVRSEAASLQKFDFDIFIHNSNLVQHDSVADRLLKDGVFNLPQFYALWHEPHSKSYRQISHLETIYWRRKGHLFVQFLALQNLKGDDDPDEIIERLGIEAKFPDLSRQTLTYYLCRYLKELKEWECNGAKGDQTIEDFRKHVIEDSVRKNSEEIWDTLTKKHEILKSCHSRHMYLHYNHLQLERLSRECASVVEKVVVPQANEKLRRVAEGVERGAKWWGKRGVREASRWSRLALVAGVGGAFFATKMTLKTTKQ